MSDLSEGLRLFITNTARPSRLDVGGEIDNVRHLGVIRSWA